MKIKNINFDTRICEIEMFDFRNDFEEAPRKIGGRIVKFDIDNIKSIQYKIICDDDVLIIRYNDEFVVRFDMCGALRNGDDEDYIDLEHDFDSFADFVNYLGGK